MLTKITTLQQFRTNNIHKQYIEHIRYPFFRNLEVNTKITFDFPISFLVGKNGGGKSSTLQSLYGCPKGYSLGDYWFTTELDPIKEFDKNRNCFIYGFKNGNNISRCNFCIWHPFTTGLCGSYWSVGRSSRIDTLGKNKFISQTKNLFKMKKNILVLCTGNSCRSQIAEGYFKVFCWRKSRNL